jgi:hypothetical protein
VVGEKKREKKRERKRERKRKKKREGRRDEVMGVLSRAALCVDFPVILTPCCHLILQFSCQYNHTTMIMHLSAPTMNQQISQDFVVVYEDPGFSYLTRSHTLHLGRHAQWTD